MAYYKKISLLILSAVAVSTVQAQLSVGNTASMAIASGTIVSFDGLVITPAANYTLSNTTLTRAASITHSSVSPSIARVYKFSNALSGFTGALQMSYATGEIGSIPENSLQLNYHNGTIWNTASGTLNTTNKTYSVAALGPVSLSEITLANSAAPLPIELLNFTAAADGRQSLLKWTIANGSKTSMFQVEHSSDARQWQNIGVLKASAASADNDYSFHHAAPLSGANYYRLLLTDLDGSTGYSGTVMVAFTTSGMGFKAWPNPAGESITVAVPTAGFLTLTNAAGQQLQMQQIAATGTSVISLKAYPAASYWLTFRSDELLQTVHVIRQ